MQDFLSTIRKPIKSSGFKPYLMALALLWVGIVLGVFSKMLDLTPSNLLPLWMQWLDLGNFFSRVGVWLWIAIFISVVSPSPLQAALRVFLFFGGMVSSYFGYTIFFAGFFPKAYMMIWLIWTLISPWLAILVWYAKGKGLLALIISSLIMTMMFRQAFAFGLWYFDIRNILELGLWLATIFVLTQNPKQIGVVMIISLILYFLTAQWSIFGGML